MSSKYQPYRKNDTKTKQHFKQQGSRLAQKSRMGKSRQMTSYTPERKISDPPVPYKLTERKPREVRIQTLLEQNKYLLAENSQLSALVGERGKMILTLQQKLEQQMSMEIRTLEEIQFQKNRFIKQYHLKTNQYDRRIEGLLGEIGNLHQQLYILQQSKQSQIQELKNIHSIEQKRQVESLMSSHNSSIQVLQLQIYKLKQDAQRHYHQFNKSQQENKMIQDRLKHEINSLKEQISHLNHKHKIQFSQQKIQNENNIQNILKDAKKQEENYMKNAEIQIKKLRYQISNKQREIQHMKSSLHIGKVENQTKQNQLIEKRTQLQNQILQIQQQYKTLFFNEKQHLKDLHHSEIQNLHTTYKSELENIRNQNMKLKQLNQLKTHEFDKIYDQINLLRTTKDSEYQQALQTIQQLKQRLSQMKNDNLEDQEAFKIKMAHLHNSDIESLRRYYEDQTAILTQDIEIKDNIIQQNRQKVHRQIQQKTELRKVFESQVCKLKIRIGELQVKLAMCTTQRRQQHSTMNSKIEVTSMNLIRETNQRQKNILFYEQQKRKLKLIIDSKDEEITNLIDKINQEKEDHSKQIVQKEDIIENLKIKCQDLQKSLKKQNLFYQSEIKKRQLINQNDKNFYEKQIQKLKEEHNQQYKNTMNELTHEKAILEKQRNQLKTLKKDLEIQLHRIKELKEQEGINKDITLQAQKNRLQSQKNLLEVGLKNYYQTEIKAKSQQINDLKQQLRQKQQDIRDMTEKHHKLQKKLSQLLQSQQKLREIQNKVLAIGQNNNAIKNFAQILRNRKRY